MDYIINHKRFKKKYSFNELDKYLWSEKRISKFPHSIKGYFDFFNGYAKKNYKGVIYVVDIRNNSSSSCATLISNQ